MTIYTINDIKAADDQAHLSGMVEQTLAHYGVDDAGDESYAETANRLRAAYDSIESGSFAEACYDTNSINELSTAEPDQSDMGQWGIDEQQWRDAVNTARLALIGDKIADMLDAAEAMWFEQEA